jgi:hypothetical protein
MLLFPYTQFPLTPFIDSGKQVGQQANVFTASLNADQGLRWVSVRSYSWFDQPARQYSTIPPACWIRPVRPQKARLMACLTLFYYAHHVLGLTSSTSQSEAHGLSHSILLCSSRAGFDQFDLKHRGPQLACHPQPVPVLIPSNPVEHILSVRTTGPGLGFRV